MTEEWRPVAGYEGLYEVSDQGRVRSLDRVVERRGGLAAGKPMRQRGRILRQRQRVDTPHMAVKLNREGAQRTFSVHVLVLTAFVGPRPDGLVACHYDGDASNNLLGNLRWDTQSENQRDAVRHGTHSRTRRTHCPRGHQLLAPNLRPSQVARGYRQCLACHRAGAAAQKAERAGQQVDVREIADRRYAVILGAVA